MYTRKIWSFNPICSSIFSTLQYWTGYFFFNFKNNNLSVYWKLVVLFNYRYYLLCASISQFRCNCCILQLCGFKTFLVYSFHADKHNLLELFFFLFWKIIIINKYVFKASVNVFQEIIFVTFSIGRILVYIIRDTRLYIQIECFAEMSLK